MVALHTQVGEATASTRGLGFLGVRHAPLRSASFLPTGAAQRFEGKVFLVKLIRKTESQRTH